MSKFKDFVDFLVNNGIINTEHTKILQSKSPEPFEESEILSTIANFLKNLQNEDYISIAKNLYQKFMAGYDNLSGFSKDLAFLRSIIGNPTNPTAKTKSTSKKTTITKSTNTHNYEKLYADSFEKDKFLKLKKQAQMTEILKDCTFTPQINQNKIVSKKLEVPVFERLSKQTTKHIKGFPESHKQIMEMQECTFRPQILKYMNQINTEREFQAFERLYENADSLRQNQKAKKQNYEENEKKELIFAPEINKTSDIIMKKKRGDLQDDSPFDRLYNISVEKKIQAKNEEFSRLDENEYTFKPETHYTENYQKNSKILQEHKNLNIYDRLYMNQNDIKLKNSNSFSKNQEKSKNSDKKNSEKKKNLKEDKSTPIFNRLYNQRFLKAKKIDEIKKVYYKENGITFRPKINETPRNLSVSCYSNNSSARKSARNQQEKYLNKSFSTKSMHLDSNKKKKRDLNAEKNKNKSSLQPKPKEKKESLIKNSNPFEGNTFVEQVEKFVENSITNC